MGLIFDIETDGYLEHCTKIHCIVAEDYDTGKVHTFSPTEIEEGLDLLAKADLLIGHNIMSFDIPAIKKLYPKWGTSAKMYDTLLVAKYAYPDIKEMDFSRLRKVIRKPNTMRTELEREMMRNIGKHSLEAYGLRLSIYKGKFGKEVGFETYSEDMLKYCIQDVSVNAKLYHKLKSLELDEAILDIEHEAHRICLEQTGFGFQFDYDKAIKLENKLEKEMILLQDEIKSILGGPFVIPLEVKVPKRTVKYKDVLRANEYVGAAFTKIKVKEFNPTSRHDVATRLIERCGWKPKVFGNDKKPTLSEEILDSCKIPACKLISKMFVIQKRLGMLTSGANAWKKLYNVDTKAIHGQVDTLGTGTHRCTHKRPNLGQIPSTRAIYGRECRELFTVPKGWKLFGTDAAGLELRMLAHYMTPFDDGAYADVILNGDIHIVNQKAAGLPSRDNAKVFIYALLYGAGDEKIGSTINGTKKDGKRLKGNFFKATPAMKTLTDKVKQAAEFRGYVISLDGRRIPVRSIHSALNFLLQSAGAIVCKYWMVELHRLLKDHGYISGIDFKQSAYVHDELQIAFDPEKIDGLRLGQLSREAIVTVGTKLNLRIPLDIGYDIGDTYADTH